MDGASPTAADLVHASAENSTPATIEKQAYRVDPAPLDAWVDHP